MNNCSKGRKVKIKERDKHKKARREAALKDNITGTNSNSCNVLQVPEEEEVDKGGIIHTEYSPLPRGTQVRFKDKKWLVIKNREDGKLALGNHSQEP